MLRFDPMVWSIPFFLGTASQEHKLNITRVVEALIIAGVAGGVSVYSAQQVTAEKMNSLSSAIERIEANQLQIQRDMYKPVIGKKEE